MKPKIFNASVVIMALLTLSMYSCKKEKDSPVPSGDSTYSVPYLSFSNQQEFKEALDSVYNPQERRVSYQSNSAFRSMFNIYQSVLDAEYQVLAEEEALIRQDSSRMQTMTHQYASLTRQYWHLFNFEDNIMSLKIASPGIARLVNEDGIVQIGGRLYQYTGDDIRVLENESEIEPLSSIARTTGRTTTSVVPGSGSTTNSRTNGVPAEQRCEARNGDYMVIGNVYNDVTTDRYLNPQYGYFIRIRTFKKTWYGSWIGYRTYSINSEGYYDAQFTNGTQFYWTGSPGDLTSDRAEFFYLGPTRNSVSDARADILTVYKHYHKAKGYNNCNCIIEYY